jgi:GNAT superfamily N-acetyltransferase
MPEPSAMHRYYLADTQSEYTAHVEIDEADGVLWMTNLWVSEELRGKGVARALISRALKDWPGRTIYLTIRPYADKPVDFERLKAFYTKMGFIATDVPGVLKR